MKNTPVKMVLLVVLAGTAASESRGLAAGTPQPLPTATAQAAAEQGRKIIGDAFQLLSSNLQNAIQNGGISNALPFCSVAALPLTRSIAERDGVVIRRFSHKPRNPQGRADATEMAILKRFEAALTVTNAPAPIVTNLAPGQITFFAPIVLNQSLCLKCHGQPGKDILPDDNALIDKLYPRDEAKGFEMGKLRGAWRIDFPLATSAKGDAQRAQD